jgi:hypothetical protein
MISVSTKQPTNKGAKPKRGPPVKSAKPAKAARVEAVAPVATPGANLTIGETSSAPVEAPAEVVPVVAELVVSTIELAPPNLADLEQVIASGLRTFVDVGQALTRIRDGELYKATHASFEAYCAERWDMRRAHAYRLIDAAGVVENVSNWRQQKLAPPTVESQARELARLPPKEQPKAWAQVLKSAPDGVVTAEHVAKIVLARLPERVPKAKTKPVTPAPVPVVALPAVAPDSEAALADDLDRLMVGWTLGHERFIAALKASALRARHHFGVTLKEAANG